MLKIVHNSFFLLRMSEPYQTDNRDDCRRMGSHSLKYAVNGALWLLCSALLPKVALTQDSSDPMEVCFRVSDSAARLACFDNEMRRRHAGAPRPPSTTVNSTAAPTQVPDDTVGLDGRQLILKRKAEHIPAEVVKPIVAALIRMTQRPGHQYLFELQNGQLWESTDTEPDLFLSPHEMVTIRPGVLGAFFLKSQEGNSIRVHRLR
jgi:hypothetical protein